MKLCPKCGQSFAEGFTYCPKDAARLEKYDLRARIRRDDELHFLLESESLITRLKREMACAFVEMKVNPRAFLRGLLRGEGTTRQRKRLLRAGFASGLLVYSSVFVAVSLVGLLQLSTSKSSVSALPDPEPLGDVRLLLPIITIKTEKNQAKSGAGLLGGSLPQRKPPKGGGGANDQKRTSRGVPPLPSLNPQLAQPSLDPPVIEHSTLIIRPSVIADPNSMIHIKGPVGTLDSPPDAPPSRGPGAGTGIGEGNGPGYRQGADGGIGGGSNRQGGGRPTGCCDGVPVMSENLKPTILYRERAKYTEEARLNKIEGTVLLTIVFGADGRIHDIRTVRGLPYGLTETSIEAAQKIRFHPAVQNGKPVSVRATLEFSFALY
ncbi:MAG TPA: energy transducer TonB [Blastocatellia bacterium]|jgi:TonB family protein|nr:energy transducer TonB [Blastocatellia bacterium]